MKRWELINSLIKKNNYNDYLGIGIRINSTFSKVNVKNKDGVDPRGKPTYKMTSDKFFNQYCKKKYDIIFIDGLHEEEQAMKDIENSLNVLKENGTIVVHDCNPKNKKAQLVPQQQKVWNGNVWKAFVRYRCTRNDLKMYVVNTDHGCGIIQRGNQEAYGVSQDKCLNWDYFKNHKKEMLNLISVDEFKKLKK